MTVGVSPGTELTAELTGAELTVEVPVRAGRPTGRRRGAGGRDRARAGRRGQGRRDDPGRRAGLDDTWCRTSTTTRSGGTPRRRTPSDWDVDRARLGRRDRRSSSTGVRPGRAHLERGPARPGLPLRAGRDSTTSSRTGTPTRRSARSCAGCSPRAGCELVGGTYNEPNTNLTGVESTIRNFVYGIGFQRDILGGDPQTAWQLDAFGHDPQFPGLCAERRADRVRVGPRAVPPVGTAPPALASHGGTRPR